MREDNSKKDSSNSCNQPSQQTYINNSDLESASGGVNGEIASKIGRMLASDESEWSRIARDRNIARSEDIDRMAVSEIGHDGNISMDRILPATENAAQGSKGLTKAQKIALGVGGSAGAGLGGWGISELVNKFKGKDSNKDT